MVEQGWVYNEGTRIYYLDTTGNSTQTKTPLIFVPGMLGAAEDYLQQMGSLAPRRCVALSLRGRGKSDMPERGYSFENHVSDIEAVIDALGLRNFCLYGHSVGVAFSIGYAIRNAQSLRGLILCDFPARYLAYPPQWAEYVIKNYPERAKPHVSRAIQAESREVVLWGELHKIHCPALILRAGRTQQPGKSLLSEGEAKMYAESLPSARVVEFPDSGHDLWETDYDSYVRAIEAFLKEIDANGP